MRLGRLGGYAWTGLFAGEQRRSSARAGGWSESCGDLLPGLCTPEMFPAYSRGGSCGGGEPSPGPGSAVGCGDLCGTLMGLDSVRKPGRVASCPAMPSACLPRSIISCRHLSRGGDGPMLHPGDHVLVSRAARCQPLWPQERPASRASPVRAEARPRGPTWTSRHDEGPSRA